MDLKIEFLSPASDRAHLFAELASVNAEAKREMRVDSLGRANQHWADLHEFMNLLLELLGF